MEKYVIEALFKMMYPSVALKRLKNPFSPMVNGDLSTLWEGWKFGTGWTYNHAWSGGGLTITLTTCGGNRALITWLREGSYQPRENRNKFLNC